MKASELISILTSLDPNLDVKVEVEHGIICDINPNFVTKQKTNNHGNILSSKEEEENETIKEVIIISV